MIENEDQLRYSVTAVAKMYSMSERIAAETIGDPSTRRDEIDGVESMVRKIEREIAVYLAAKYGIAPGPAGSPEQSELAEQKKAAGRKEIMERVA